MTRESHLLRMVDLCADALAHLTAAGRSESARAQFARDELERAGDELDALHDAETRSKRAGQYDRPTGHTAAEAAREGA